jgi:hypothetical protein
LLSFREFIRVDFLVALKSKGMGEANEMAVALATFPSTFDRGSFFFHLTDPADQHGPSNQFSIEGRGEDAKVRLQHLAELVVSEYASAKALRSAFEETSMAFAQRITCSVRQRCLPDDRDFASLRLLDCALDAQGQGQKAYVVRQVWLALSLYSNK